MKPLSVSIKWVIRLGQWIIHHTSRNPRVEGWTATPCPNVQPTTGSSLILSTQCSSPWRQRCHNVWQSFEKQCIWWSQVPPGANPPWTVIRELSCYQGVPDRKWLENPIWVFKGRETKSRTSRSCPRSPCSCLDLWQCTGQQDEKPRKQLSPPHARGELLPAPHCLRLWGWQAVQPLWRALCCNSETRFHSHFGTYQS